ncbi:MAG: DUF484 family protein [Pseudomonadota bacterium]|nr:DUF484 family protein [Pseudomonadota bacterium]
MGRVIQFEERAVATLRERLGQAESARADLAAFARGHSGAVAAIHCAVIAAMEAEDFDSLVAVVTREWPTLLGLDCVTMALMLGEQGFRIDLHGVSRCEPALISLAAGQVGEVALRSVERGHPLFGYAADSVRAEALIALDVEAPYPRGLLLLGQSGAVAEQSDQASQLLQFLGAALGAMLRQWARNS